MKKYLIVILATLLLLTSCAKFDYTKEPDKVETKADQPIQNDTTPSVDDSKENIDNSYFEQYQMSEEGFSNLVKGNAIDRDYKIESDRFQKSPEFNTQGWIELENKYSKTWDEELNNIYKKLLKKLNEAEKKKFTEAQKGWVAFHINETEFVAEAWSDLGLGSQGKVQLVMAQKERIRIRTLQLMEYYHLLGGEIEFLYKGMNE